MNKGAMIRRKPSLLLIQDYCQLLKQRN